MLKSGVISVYMRISRNGSSSKSSNCNENEIKVDIAELREQDIFGLVEITDNSKKMRREALASTCVEAFIIQANTFRSFFRNQPKTLKLIERVAQKRMNWEKVRRDFAMKFSSMPLTLPKNAIKISNYHLSHLSILSEREMKIREEKRKTLNRSMREIRLLQRSESSCSSVQLENICKEVINLSSELNDKVKRQHALSIIKALKQDT
jgi:hypothetical protein